MIIHLLKNAKDLVIERMHSRVQQPRRLIGTKKSVYITKEFNCHRIGLVNQHGCRLMVLEHQRSCHDVICLRSIRRMIMLGCLDTIKIA